MFEHLIRRWSKLQWAPWRDDPDDATMPESGPEDIPRYRELRDAGLELLAAGHGERALESLAAAAALAHRLPEAHINLARAFSATGRWEAARQALDWARILNTSSQDREVNGQIAEQWRGLPKAPPGRKDFEKDQVLHSSLTGNRWTVLAPPILGGYGAVYKVRDHDDARIYALKTFKATLLWSEEDRSRFTREGAIWLRLPPHPNIVSAEWIEVIEDFPCIVQEFVEGGDLAHLLRTQSLQLTRALELALQFCDAMAFANDEIGLVHRDVKPSNCLLTSTGTLKVGDFGLAHELADLRAMRLGLVALSSDLKWDYTTPQGTKSYMAPEQYDGTSVLDTRTDIHGFGVMFFQMLTGQVPTDGRFAHRDLAHSMADFKLPKSLWNLILRCVEPAPEERPRSFHEVRDEIGHILQKQFDRRPPRPAVPLQVGSSYWQNRAVAFQVLEMFDDAVRCCQNALKTDHNNADVWQNQGAILHRLGRNDEALQSLKRALAGNSDDPDILNNLALVCRDLNQNDDALAYIEEAKRQSPSDPRILKNHAEFLYQRGNLAEALVSASIGLSLSPREVPLQEIHAFILLAQGDAPGALSELKAALDIAPRRFGLWKCKALAHESLREQEEAEQACIKALEIQPKNEEILRIQARIRPSAT